MDKASVVAALRNAASFADSLLVPEISESDGLILRTLAERIDQANPHEVGTSLHKRLTIDWTPIGDRKP